MRGGFGGGRGWFRCCTKCAGCEQALTAGIDLLNMQCSGTDAFFNIFFSTMPTFSFYAFHLEINETWSLKEKNTKLFWVNSLGICFAVSIKYNTIAANHSDYQVIYAVSFLLRNRIGHGSKHLKNGREMEVSMSS